MKHNAFSSRRLASVFLLTSRMKDFAVSHFQLRRAFPHSLASDTPGTRNWCVKSDGSQLAKRAHWDTQTSMPLLSMWREISVGEESKTRMVKIPTLSQGSVLRW